MACPLHEGRFDLASGDPAQMPTTGGLDPDGVYHPTWSPAGRDPKVDPPGKKAEARRLTRVRRFRYYPVRIVDGAIEVAVPRRLTRSAQLSRSSALVGGSTSSRSIGCVSGATSAAALVAAST